VSGGGVGRGAGDQYRLEHGYGGLPAAYMDVELLTQPRLYPAIDMHPSGTNLFNGDVRYQCLPSASGEVSIVSFFGMDRFWKGFSSVVPKKKT